MDQIEFTTYGRRWRAEVSAPVDLAITLQFSGPQPRFFADAPASAAPLRAGRFTGTVAGGASCNCSVYTLSPHCHGTHTECVGHVTDNATALAGLTPVPPALAVLVTVRPEPRGEAAAGTTGQRHLYQTLEHKIIPLYYDHDTKEIPHEWIAMVKNTMRTIIPQFSTRRMVKEYVEKFYAPALKS